MNVFLLLILTSASFAATYERVPNCKEMGNIIQNYESRLQGDSIKECKGDVYKTLVKDIPVTNPEFLKDRICQDLSTIETQLNQHKMELAVLDGINKLVETVRTSKEKAASPKAEVAKASANSFIDSLNTAQSLELLVTTAGEDGRSVLAALKKFPKNTLMTENDLRDRMREVCKARSRKEVDACNDSLFRPGKVATEEILGLIRNTNVDDQDIQTWSHQLAIKKKNAGSEDKPYTFTQMQAELSGAFSKIDSKDVMSKEHIRAIAALDDFEFDDRFNFVKNIKELRSQKKVKEASDKFFLLMGDAKARQRHEVQSKLSIVWDDVKNAVPLNDEEKGQCFAAKSSYDAAALCASALEKNLPQVTDPLALPKLKNFLPALRTSIDYIETLAKKESTCAEEIKKNEEVSAVCFLEFNRDRAKIQDQILQLNLVKEKIGAQNVDLMKLRNFALKKYTDKNCHTQSSSMDMCEDESILPKEALLTAEDSMRIAVHFTKTAPEISEAEKNVEALCRTEDGKPVKSKALICAFFWERKEDDPRPGANKEEIVRGDIAPHDAGNSERVVRDAWIEGAGKIAGSILPQLFPGMNQGQNMYNPYPYNYGPYGSGTGPMGIADTIMFNSRFYGGYGYYMPTPGYMPYTAFGSSSPMSSYKPLAAPSTRYFSY